MIACLTLTCSAAVRKNLKVSASKGAGAAQTDVMPQRRVTRFVASVVVSSAAFPPIEWPTTANSFQPKLSTRAIASDATVFRSNGPSDDLAAPYPLKSIDAKQKRSGSNPRSIGRKQ